MNCKEVEAHLFLAIQNAESIPADPLVKDTIGKSVKLMEPQPPYATAHDAIPLLEGYTAQGCPMDCGTDWILEHILAMIMQGPHWLAMARAAIVQLCQETTEKLLKAMRSCKNQKYPRWR